MQISERSTPWAMYPEKSTLELRKHAQRVVERLVTGNGILALDVDGVFLDGNIAGDRFTDPSFLYNLPILDKFINLRLITARSENIIPTIRNLIGKPLRLSGPHIIEEGHAWLMDDTIHPMVPEEYINFFRSLHTDLQNNGLCPSWNEVKLNENRYCWGDSRWQGRYSGSVWFRYQDYGYMKPKLQNMITDFSDKASVPVDYHFNSQPNNDLSWMRIRSADVHKAHRLHTLGLPDVYVCDGPNDRQAVTTMKPDILFPYMRNTGGIIIAVRSSPDEETEDMRWVQRNADITIGNYQELGDLFSLVTQKLPFV